MASLVLTYSKARENLARLMDRVTEQREVAIITRRNKEDVVLLARDEFDGLMETVHLLRSPANRQRLFAAMEAAEQGKGEIVDVSTLRHDLGLSDDDA